MKRTKHALFVATVITAVVLMGGWALARGHGEKGGGRYPGSGRGCHVDLPPELKEKLEAERESFHKDTAELRRQLHQKRLEFQLLWIDPKSSPDDIKSKQREMFDLKRQFQEKRLDHILAVRDLLPQEYRDQMPLGRGFGMGHGPGSRKGPGWKSGSGPRGDYGKGPCW